MKCGYELGCSKEGEVKLTATGGGLIGYACHKHAEVLNQEMERNSEQNEKIHEFVPLVPGSSVGTCRKCLNDHVHWIHGR